MTGTELVAHARSFLHVRETAPNVGDPEISGWQKRLGCKPGDSYCACFACCMVEDLDPGNPLKPSASALHLLAHNPGLRVATDDMQPGDILIYDHGAGKGHVAIATQTIRISGKLASFDTIAGNTSADGKSSNGDRVAEHEASFDRLAGVLRVCSEPLLS